MLIELSTELITELPAELISNSLTEGHTIPYIKLLTDFPNVIFVFIILYSIALYN